MKAMLIVVVMTVLAILTGSSLFGQGRSGSGASGQNDQKKSASAFVEDDIPSGMALIYVYRTKDAENYFGTPLILSKSGPISIIPIASYFVFAAEAGTLKLWLTAASAVDFKIVIVAGQAYYLKFGFRSVGLGRELTLLSIPSEKAKIEIAGCNRLPD